MTSSQNESRNLPLLGALGIGLIVFLFLLVFLTFSGRRDDVNGIYGKRRGAAGAAESVNGTAVLATMFEKAGSKVTSISELNRGLERFDAVVWFPNDFAMPPQKVRDYLETWLAARPGRTLVYVGRDFNALPEYWRRMTSIADAQHAAEYARREAFASSEADTERLQMPLTEPCEWFTMKTDMPPRKIDSLDGPWASGVDATKANVVLNGRLDIPEPGDQLTEQYERPEIDILLQSENDILAHRFERTWWSGSQVIVIPNGSFLLNMPLVNRENRKLAGQLIAEVQSKSGANVAFLESGEGGPKVDPRKSRDSSTSALRLFMIWPMSFLVIHFAALGIAFCIAMSPIFGRPKHLPNEQVSDFGQHVTAIAEHLARTKDVAYAETRIRQYQSTAKRKSGKSHRAEPVPATRTPPPPVVPANPSPIIPVMINPPDATKP